MSVEPTKDGPKTFEELLGDAGGGAKPLPLCSRCGKRATHKVSLNVVKQTGAVGRGKATRQVARHGNNLCEFCAVTVYAKFREVIR